MKKPERKTSKSSSTSTSSVAVYYKFLTDVMNSQKLAYRWLHTTRPEWNHRTAAQMIENDEAYKVMEMIYDILL